MNGFTRWMFATVAFMLVTVAGVTTTARAASPADEASFATEIDLSTLGRIAVFGEGRLKSFGSHANTFIDAVAGPRRIGGQPAAYTYVDLIVRPEAYDDVDLIYVKNRQIRQSIADLLRQRTDLDPDMPNRMTTFESSGLIAPRFLRDQSLVPLFRELEADLIKTAKQVDAINQAMMVADGEFLYSRLRIVPPFDGATDRPWRSIDDATKEVQSGIPDPNDADRKTEQERLIGVVDAWREFATAWKEGDAARANKASADLADRLRAFAKNPAIYPEEDRLAWEHWYFVKDQLTQIWMIYLLSLAILLVGFIYRWKPAFYAGTGVFLIAFALQTFATLLRWYISGRWPNANMFEAVTTSAWFGGCGALVIEWLTRKTAMRSLFLIGSAATSMVALMTAHFLPAYLNPNISNMMPVLHDVWLYIHTNVIIFSYVLIFMAAVSAVCYLVWRLLGGGPAFARAGGAGAVVLAGVGPTGAATTKVERTSVGEVLDGVTMVLMELSFVLLWAGIAMGAIWADHSWGRPWGWDPKEVFALNTFLVFLVLVHIRLKVADKGLWTALLAVFGAGVMLFNWIVINFVITGLHSYA